MGRWVEWQMLFPSNDDNAFYMVVRWLVTEVLALPFVLIMTVVMVVRVEVVELVGLVVMVMMVVVVGLVVMVVMVEAVVNQW